MSNPFDSEAWLDAVAPALGLSVPPDGRSAVIGSLNALAGAARLVLDMPLDEVEDEPAPVFTA